MSSILTKEFNQLGCEGIVGPHERGYGPALMLKGLKPVLLLANDSLQENAVPMLDQAVLEGRLKKEIILSSTFDHAAWGHSRADEYFYCLPEKEADMRELVTFYSALWTGKVVGISPKTHKRIGTILGYTDNDIALFLGTKYTQQETEFLRETSDQRRHMRYGHFFQI